MLAPPPSTLTGAARQGPVAPAHDRHDHDDPDDHGSLGCDHGTGGDGALTRGLLIQTILAGVLAVGSEVVVIAGHAERSLLVAAMAAAAIALGGRATLRSGLRALVERRLTMSLLMTVAVIGAVIIGQWPEAAVVIWLFGLAELIESLSLERARNAIRALVDLAPETAQVRTAGGVEQRPSSAVAIGDTILVRPGERVALDGVVTAGTSSIDQSPITGESIPVGKAPDDAVFAGTVNGLGLLEVRVTAPKGAGTLDRIAASVQAAQANRAPAQRFVDRFASIYTPIVFVVAVVTATLPVVLGHGGLTDWVYRALVLLVLACPCALVIATPVTVVAGLGGAARRGILIKGGVHLEQARRVRTIAVDKTGTLTTGRPAVTDVSPLDGRDRDELLAVAASIEAYSEHPVAHAVCTAWSGERLEVTEVEAIPGCGVAATVGGTRYWIGSHRLVDERDLCRADLRHQIEGLEEAAKTVLVLMSEHEPLGVVAVADVARPESAVAIGQLAELGIETVMLTGDNVHTAEAVARDLGVGEVHGGLLPDDKADRIAELARRGPVAMAGDGVNDAPALATADLGIAMGAAGTDTAIETADVALMDDDPRKLAELIRISQHTTHVLWQNIVFSIAVKAVFFGLTFAGVASLWLAVLADMGASLIVIANGLRLLPRPSCARTVDTHPRHEHS